MSLAWRQRAPARHRHAKRVRDRQRRARRTATLRPSLQGGGGLLERAVIQHELGHLLGLDHVDDAGQLIYSETRGGVTGFGSGDLNGLAALGGGAVRPTTMTRKRVALLQVVK